MKIDHKIILALVSIVALALTVLLHVSQPHKYPKNEKHYRLFCKSRNLQALQGSLRIYLLENGNVLPIDFVELNSKVYMHREGLVCPSQYEKLKELDYIEDESIIISSYRLMRPGGPFDEIEDGEIIVQELPGNHHNETVGDERFKEGYHVIIKKNDSFEVLFVETQKETKEKKHSTD